MAEKSSGSPSSQAKLYGVCAVASWAMSCLSPPSKRGSRTLARIYLFIYTCACVLNCWTYATSLPQIQQFHFAEEPQDIVAIKDMSTLLHCSAHHPSQTPNIEWKKDGEYIKFEGENRRYRLENGSLYFNQVHHSKGPDGDKGDYQCVATVEGLGSICSRVAHLKIAHLARTFDIEPQIFNPQLYLGDTAMFKCSIEGTPDPSISWYRDGELLQERNSVKGDKIVHIYENDGVLEINSVEFTDYGSYQCEASNVDRTRKSRSVDIVQNPKGDYQGVVPHFVMKPVDSRGIASSTIYLFCGANGQDRKGKQPMITWLKDGTTIDTTLHSRFSIVGKGSLKITKLDEEDAGTYTCRARNLEDSIDADALLHVLVPPKIVKGPKDLYAHVKSDVLFECEAHGIPQPTMTWMKNGDQISPSDYFQITDKRGLRILGLVNSDDGIYQCFVENELGTIQASAQLVILQSDVPIPQPLSLTTPPVLHIGDAELKSADLPSPPTNLVNAITSNRFVTLLWREPQKSGVPENIVMYSVYWKEKGSDRERVVNTTTLEANIQHLKPNTEYEFRVISYNHVGPSKDVATLTVRTEPEVFVPSPATNVRATTLSSTSIQVDWHPPENTHGEIVQYELVYYEVGANGEHEITVDDVTHTLTRLHAFTEYSFRVVAHNENGPGSTTEEFVARTYSDRPSAEPQNVTLEVSTTTSIIVRWEPPPDDKQNGIITGYKIRYKKKGSQSQIATPDKNRRSFALTSLQRNMEYQVRVAALTVNGSGPATEWYSASTLRDDLDESQVPGQPAVLRLQPMSNSIMVRWAPPSDMSVAVKGYILGYGIGIPDVYSQDLDTRQLQFKIENLRPASEYVISLKAYNQMGHGPTKLETVVTREEPTAEPATPMIPPVGLKAIVLSAKTIVLTWTDTTLGKNQRINDNRYYTVRYSTMPNKNNRFRHSNSTDLNIHLDDLKPNTQYEFSVKVIKGRRQSTWSLNVFNKTFESAPGSIPRDLTPVPVEGNPMAVTLNWQPPQRPNGQITGYLVFYTTDSSQADRDWVVEGVLGDDLSTTITDLTPDTAYFFKVQARNSKGYGPMSPTVIYRTPRADGTGGGHIVTPDKGAHNYLPPGRPKTTKDVAEKKAGSTEQKGISMNVLIIIIACVVGATFCIVIVVVTFILCRRRNNNIDRTQRNKGTYKSPSKGPVKDVKPPDLWIHHDHLELKNMQKTGGGEPSMTVTPIPRNSQEIKNEDVPPSLEMDRRRNSFVGPEPPSYEPHSEERYQRPVTVRPKPIMIPVDSKHPPREPIATVTAMPNGHITQGGDIPMRPVYPRTQYNTQYSSTPRVHAGDVSQPSSIYGTDDESEYDPNATDPLLEDRSAYMSRIGYGPQTPESPKPFHDQAMSPNGPKYHHQYLSSPAPSSGALSGTDQDGLGSSSLPRRTTPGVHGNPLHSFKVPGPPSAPTTPRPKHIVKPQQPVNSPYKKPNPPISCAPVKPRVPVVHHRAPDVTIKEKKKEDPERQKSLSTEELTAEMANLEGLMKDLNAITQQEFEC